MKFKYLSETRAGLKKFVNKELREAKQSEKNDNVDVTVCIYLAQSSIKGAFLQQIPIKYFKFMGVS